MVLVEAEVVVGLQEHVGELGVRDGFVWIFDALFDGFFGHHVVDGDVFADLAEEIDVAHVGIEVFVVDDFKIKIMTRQLTKMLEHALDLVRDGRDIGLELFWREK